MRLALNSGSPYYLAKGKPTISACFTTLQNFSTLYTTIPHDQLKSRLQVLIIHCFFYSNEKRRYKDFVLGRQNTYFVTDHSDCTTKLTETDIVSMLEFLLDNIFVVFDGQIFQQTIGMGTNCVPLLTGLFLYSYEAEFIQFQFHIQVHT